MKYAFFAIIALLALACSEAPTVIDVEGVYNLISIDGEPLPVNGTTAGQLRLGFYNNFEVELCGADGACMIVIEGTVSRRRDRLLLEGADSVTEATLQGTLLTLDLDGAAHVFEPFMPGG